MNCSAALAKVNVTAGKKLQYIYWQYMKRSDILTRFGKIFNNNFAVLSGVPCTPIFHKNPFQGYDPGIHRNTWRTGK